MKLHWAIKDDPWYRWSDTISAAVLLTSAVVYAFTNKSWFLVGAAVVIGAIFGWCAEQEWRIHLRRERDDEP
jgi:hypothetical protein